MVVFNGVIDDQREAMSDGLFRQQALQRAGTPDELDRLVRVGGSGAWAALAGLAVALLALLVWAATASVPVTVSGPGLILGPGGVVTLNAPAEGTLVEIAGETAHRIEAGAALLRLARPDGAQTLAAPADAVVTEWLARPGDTVPSGAPLVRLLPVASPEEGGLRAHAYLPADGADRVAAGQSVAVQGGDGGRPMTGTVAAVAPLPASREAMVLRLGNPALADAWLADGPVREIVVDLSGSGARAGGIARVEITTARLPVLALLLPGLFGEPAR